MEDAGPLAAAAAAAAGGDWRSQINPLARQVMVANIFKTLRWHLPLSDEQGRSRLQKIAVGFEGKFYNEATSKHSYKRKIAMLLIYVEKNQNSHRQENGAGDLRSTKENGADDKGKAPVSESLGDEITPLRQEFLEAPTCESTENRATNLKKHKFDCSSSSAPPLG